MKIVIELKDGDNGFKVAGTIERTPRQHSGWRSVTYQGRRYQLHGGIRNPEFINIKHPLTGDFFVTINGRRRFFSTLEDATKFASNYFTNHNIILTVASRHDDGAGE